MGKNKKRGKKKKGEFNPNSIPNSQNSITLRQEKTGKIKPKSSNNVKPYSNLHHLGKLAVWASGQVSIPSLAAFFGQRLAATAESLGVAPDPSLFSCQRCETILQPDSNCSVRIEKNNAKRRRRHNNCKNLTQNSVVYYCHYCSCRNVKRGTPKVLSPPKPKAFKLSKYTKSESVKKRMEGIDENGKECDIRAENTATEILPIDVLAIPPFLSGDILTIEASEIPSSRTEEIKTIDGPEIPPSGTEEIKTINGPEILPSRTEEILTMDAPPATPPASTRMILLNLKKRKRNKSTSKKQNEPENSSAPIDSEKTIGTSKRRRKKSWTSLKEIAQTNEETGKKDATLAIPFSLQGTF